MKRTSLTVMLQTGCDGDSVVQDEQQPLQNASTESPRPQSWTRNPRLLLLTVFAGLAGYLFGFDTGNISGALPYIENELLSDLKSDPHRLHVIEGLIVSGAVIGAAIGSAVGGLLSDAYGRKAALKVADLLFVGGAFLMAFSYTAPMLISGRCLVGVGVGLASVTAPVFIAETAPASIRASLVTFNTLMITFGQLTAYLASYLFTFTHYTWRWMLGVAAVPAIIQAAGLFFLPESPRWLFSKGKKAEGMDVLTTLARPADLKEEYRIEADSLSVGPSKPWHEVLKSRALRKELHLGMGLQMWQQFCGVNTVMYFTPSILRMAGVTDNRLALLVAMGPAAVNTAGTVLSMYLVDYIGRRKLLLGSMLGIIVALLCLGMSFRLSETHSAIVSEDLCTSGNVTTCTACIENGCQYCLSGDLSSPGQCLPAGTECLDWIEGANGNSCPNPYFIPIIASVLFYLATFSPGMGSIPWAVNAEIFPVEVRGLANGASATTNWVSNAIVSQLFLTLADLLGASGVFWLLAGIALLGTIWVYIFLPETKGLSFEAIQALFTGSSEALTDNSGDSESASLRSSE